MDPRERRYRLASGKKARDITTLVLGGTGKTGSRVAARLQHRDQRVRIGSRTGQPPFDWADDSTWAAALDGVDSAYICYYPDISFPEAAPRVRAFAQAAARGGVIERHFDTVYNLRGEAATIQRWLSAMPADLVRSRPRLLLAQAALADASGRAEAVEGLLDDADRAPACAADEPFEPSAGRAASMLVNVPATIALHRCYLAQLRGEAEGTVAFASRALAESGEGEWLLRSTAQGFLAVAEWLRGRLAEAERAFVSGIAGWRAAGQHTATAWGCYQLGQVQRAQGRLDAAVRTCQQALEAAAGPGPTPLPAAGPAYVGLGEVAYQRNELDSALQHVTEGIALCRRFVYTAPLATGLATLAWIQQATGDPAGALETIGEAERAAPGSDVTSPLNPVPAERARLLPAQGDIAASAAWAQQRGLGADDEPSYPREPEYLVLARVLLAHDRPGPALALLERLLAAAVSQDRTGSVIEIRTVQALALATAGEDNAAVDALAETLTLACRRATSGYSQTGARRWARCWAA